MHRWYPCRSRAHSSAGERSLHTREVPGSIPGAPIPGIGFVGPIRHLPAARCPLPCPRARGRARQGVPPEHASRPRTDAGMSGERAHLRRCARDARTRPPDRARQRHQRPGRVPQKMKREPVEHRLRSAGGLPIMPSPPPRWPSSKPAPEPRPIPSLAVAESGTPAESPRAAPAAALEAAHTSERVRYTRCSRRFFASSAGIGIVPSSRSSMSSVRLNQNVLTRSNLSRDQDQARRMLRTPRCQLVQLLDRERLPATWHMLHRVEAQVWRRRSLTPRPRVTKYTLQVLQLIQRRPGCSAARATMKSSICTRRSAETRRSRNGFHTFAFCS